ncbi:hypothetical protein [Clostridium sp. AN503]|uniref:CdiA C-terminal domain-containing protein n=1 Tax=Clostridium sp. AN503 TaxID=3160598 RepID=UPI00345752E0
MREAKDLSEEYVGECDTSFYDLLVSIDWEKVGRITSGTVRVVTAGVVIVAGISALTVSGGALGTASAALLAGETVSLAGVATALSTFLASLGSIIMSGADFPEGAENILNALQDNPERAEHLIRDKIELFRNHPAYYYIFEAILTFGSQLEKKLLTSGKVSVVKGEVEVAKGTLTGKLDGLTADERKVVNDLLDAGNDVEIIPRSDTAKMPDYYVNGVKTELKTLNGTSLNIPVTRIQDGFKQGAERVIVDARKIGITTEQATAIIDRAAGVYGGELPGTVEIWTTGGKVIR